MDPQPPATLPLFPLPGHVLLPGVPVSLRVFEPRYRTLVADAQGLPAESRWLAIPRLLEGGAAGLGATPAFAPIAAAARMLRIEPLGNGHSMIAVQGLVRVRLEEVPSGRPYRLARWTALPDVTSPGEAALLAADEVLAKVRIIARRLGDGSHQLAELIAGEDHVVIADRLAAVLLSDPDERQRHLETCDVARRLHDFARHLRSQLGPGSGGDWDFSRN
jgi:Lon protease-like protein